MIFTGSFAFSRKVHEILTEDELISLERLLVITPGCWRSDSRLKRTSQDPGRQRRKGQTWRIAGDLLLVCHA